MSDYERGLHDADAIVAGWIDRRQPDDLIETLQAIRADILFKIETSCRLAEPIRLTPEDLALRELQLEARREICGAFCPAVVALSLVINLAQFLGARTERRDDDYDRVIVDRCIRAGMDRYRQNIDGFRACGDREQFNRACGCMDAVVAIREEFPRA